MANLSGNLRAFIGVATLSKLLLNISRRMIYPFAPAFARGLGVELSAITSIIALNQATSVLGPVGACLSDRYGYKRFLLLALALLTIGTLAAGFIPLYGVLVAGLFATGLAKSIFDPSLQACIGSQVPFDQRGRVIGMTELSWAGSTLVGIPLAGMVIEHFSWQTPFWIISLLAMACFYLLARQMPGDPALATPGKISFSRLITDWKTVFHNPGVAGVLAFSFLVSLANDTLFIIYGAWLEQSCHLSLTAIGLGTILIGTAEMLGEGFTTFFSDRVGLKRSVFMGTCLCAAAYLILPLMDRTTPFVLTGLFLVFFSFELTFVTTMSLATELVPSLRASTMSAFYAISGIGRVAGALTGGLIWTSQGISGISLVSGTCTLAALGCLAAGFRWQKERETTTDPGPQDR